MKNKLTMSLGAILGTLLLTLSVSAQANTIYIGPGTAEIECTAGSVDPACEGVISANTLSATTATVFSVSPSSVASETSFLNTLMGLSLTSSGSGGGQRVELGGDNNANFVTTATWFAIKSGSGTSFFRNNGGATQLSVIYEGYPGQGAGLSHLTFWGGTTVQVPEPGTLALLGMGIMGFGLMRRKRAA